MSASASTRDRRVTPESSSATTPKDVPNDLPSPTSTWSPYDVWRSRVFQPLRKGGPKDSGA
jgi:hypothetical protein